MTHDTSSRPAESEPCRCGSTTLVTLVSSTCMKATTITDSVMAHFRAEEIGATSGGAATATLPHLDDDVGRHPGPQGVGIAQLPWIEADLHRHALHHLHPVPGRVLGRQQREARAGPRAERVDGAVEDLAGEGVDLHGGGHSRPHARELRLLE